MNKKLKAIQEGDFEESVVRGVLDEQIHYSKQGMDYPQKSDDEILHKNGLYGDYLNDASRKDLANVLRHKDEEIRIANRHREVAVQNHELACKQIGTSKTMLSEKDAEIDRLIEKINKLEEELAACPSLEIRYEVQQQIRVEAKKKAYSEILKKFKELDGEDPLWETTLRDWLKKHLNTEGGK